MPASTRLLLPAACAGLLVLSGCSGSGDSSNAQPSQPSQPSADQSQQMQQAAAGFAAVNEMGAAVTDALATEGQVAGGVTWHRAGGVLPLAAALPGWRDAGPVRSMTFSFDEDFSIPVDLDARNGAGGDKYPNATGTFTLDGTVATQSGGGNAGSFSLSLTAVATSAVTGTNPHTGDVVILPIGTELSWSANLGWTATDEQHWTLDLILTTGPDSYQATVDPVGGPALLGQVSGEFRGEYHLGRNGGTYTWEAEAEGHHTTLWTDSLGRQATVKWTVVGPDQVKVAINGREFGPYTHHQLRTLYLVSLALRG